MALPWRRDGGAAPAHARDSKPTSAPDPGLEPAGGEPEPDATGPVHFKTESEADDGPAHFRSGSQDEDSELADGDGSDERTDRPSPPHWPAWLIPVAACVVALTCIVTIAIPASLLSGGPARDPSALGEPSPAIGSVAESSVGLVDGVASLAKATTGLAQAVRAIQEGGHQVGYCVTTADGREILGYHADERFYGASSIKGPFVLRAFPDGVPEGYRQLVEDTIQHSDNESYLLLRDYRGTDILADQLEELGIEGFSPYMSYVWMTPRQLTQLWVKNLSTLKLEGEAGDWLRRTFSATDNSTIGTLKADRAWSKAGWLESEGMDTTVDAGVVVRGDRTYVMAAMTDAPEDFEALGKVVRALDAVLTALYPPAK